MWVELIESVFGTPEDILNNFDFTITKFAYYKEIVPDNVTSMPADESEDFPFDDSDDKWHWEYMLLYHRDFFEHLHQKRLVLDNKIPFPISTKLFLLLKPCIIRFTHNISFMSYTT